MPPTIKQFTGFEDGNLNRWVTSQASVSSSGSKTGTYNMVLSQPSSSFTYTINTVSSNEIYAGMWVKLTGGSGSYDIRFRQTTNLIKIQHNTTSRKFELVRGSTVIATGSFVMPTTQAWYNLQFWVNIHDTTGRFVLKVDGVVDIDFTGDTKDGTPTTITDIHFAGQIAGIDDVVVCTADYPGDFRVDGLIPNADSTPEQWTPSTGTDSYAMVDETPASDTDYLSTTTTAQITNLDLTDFTGTNKTPIAVSVVARAKKDTANNDQLRLGILSNATYGYSTHTLTTSYAYYVSILLTDPNGGGAWSDAALDAMKAYIESIIV